MTGNEIRQKFLEYFERHGHRILRSSPLLPANDPTLLFTNAGMNQFKDVFTGVEKRDYSRATTSQKCIRAGGKHNDLDEVGRTARHQTFFEMLGNFSFGDYFKEDAIRFAWDLLVNEFKLDPARLWFTVFEGGDGIPADTEAEELWHKVGAPVERILRFGKKDNFWQMGDTGPCGPCSEIHYYMGEDPDDPSKNRVELVNGPGDTTMEIWNLVFMQYERTRDETGEIIQTPLPKPSVDTGAGLERMAVVLQGVSSNYETDLLRPIIDFTAQMADRAYESNTQEGFAMRVIADHARAAAFSIADGILPGNEGRSYVLRKIMRRAIYQGRHTLGFEGQFFNKVTNLVVDLMHEAYPELETHRAFIEEMVGLEEQRFGSTLTVGLKKLDELVGASTNRESGEIELSTRELAKLYDTFGSPIDLMYVVLSQGKQKLVHQLRPDTETRHYTVMVGETAQAQTDGLQILDEEGFRKVIEEQLGELQRRDAEKHATDQRKTNPAYAAVAARSDVASDFKGYEKTAVEDSTIKALIRGDSEVDTLPAGEAGEVILDRTPFYAESGGQVGDVGRLVVQTEPGAQSTAIAIVEDTYSPSQGLIVHKVRVESGELKSGDHVSAEVDVEKRDATRRNHTATHLMHAALREVLGTHVKQAGSVVAPTYLRFDFTHYQPLTPTEIEEIEDLVNFHILRNEPVQTNVMAIEEAMRTGAMALFGEKYGAQVRVLSIDGVEGVFSKELCGGTHVRATGDIGPFKIVSDESIASGTRRIRAITGHDAFRRFQESESLVSAISDRLRTPRAELQGAIAKLQDDLKKARREADDLRLKLATGAASNGAAEDSGAREIAGIRVIAREASGLDANGMRQLSDTLLARTGSGVVIVGRADDGKVSLIVQTSKDLTKRAPAGQIIKALAEIVGGRGGGKPEMAEGGGTQPENLGKALEASYAVVEQLLSAG